MYFLIFLHLISALGDQKKFFKRDFPIWPNPIGFQKFRRSGHFPKFSSWDPIWPNPIGFQKFRKYGHSPKFNTERTEQPYLKWLCSFGSLDSAEQNAPTPGLCTAFVFSEMTSQNHDFFDWKFWIFAKKSKVSKKFPTTSSKKNIFFRPLKPLFFWPYFLGQKSKFLPGGTHDFRFFRKIVFCEVTSERTEQPY